MSSFVGANKEVAQACNCNGSRLCSRRWQHPADDLWSHRKALPHCSKQLLHEDSVLLYLLIKWTVDESLFNFKQNSQKQLSWLIWRGAADRWLPHNERGHANIYYDDKGFLRAISICESENLCAQISAENGIFGQTGPKVGSFDAGYGSSHMSRLVGRYLLSWRSWSWNRYPYLIDADLHELYHPHQAVW